MPSPCNRLKLRREALGLRPDQIAELSGLSVNNYYDIEAYRSELFQAISLADLVNVCRAVGISPYYLLTGVEKPEVDSVSFSVLRDAITTYLQARKIPLEDFEEQVGWELSGFMNSPDAAWQWNLDELRDVCGGLSIDLRNVLGWMSSEPKNWPVRRPEGTTKRV